MSEQGQRQTDREVSRTGGRRKGSEARDGEWVNIKSLLQRSQHFVPDDQHFPFVYF